MADRPVTKFTVKSRTNCLICYISTHLINLSVHFRHFASLTDENVSYCSKEWPLRMCQNKTNRGPDKEYYDNVFKR